MNHLCNFTLIQHTMSSSESDALSPVSVEDTKPVSDEIPAQPNKTITKKQRKSAKEKAGEFAQEAKKKRTHRWTEKNREAFAKCQAAKRKKLEEKRLLKESQAEAKPVEASA